MRFAFDDDALLLQTALREFLRKECPPERVRALWAGESGHDAALWRALAELGLPGARASEGHGGMGLDERVLVLLLEETGRAALPLPVVPTAAVGVPLLAELAPASETGAALAARWLPRVAAGEALVAVASPANPLVGDAGAADLLLLAHGDELHAVAREAVRLVRQPCNDPGRRLFEVAFEPGPETCVARGERARALWAAALDRGALACAAQLLGVAQQLLDLAVAYAGQREQFGRPIGSFQALQHRLADVHVKLEYARPVVYKAAHAVACADRTAAPGRGRPPPERAEARRQGHAPPATATATAAAAAARRALEVSHAKLAAGEAAALAARTALQVHGAIGYTWEQDLHLWMRRAWSLELDWGAPSFHRERVAAWVLASGAPIGPGTTFEPSQE